MKIAMLLAVVFCLLPSTGSAQGFDVQNFRPMPARSNNYVNVSSGRVLSHTQLEGGLVLHYTDDPLVVRDSDGNRVNSLVRDQFIGNALFSFGIANRLELGLDIPIIFSQRGDSIDLLPDADAAGAGAGIGDIRLVPKILLFSTSGDNRSEGFYLNLLADVYLPTGSDARYQGSGSARVAPRLATEYLFLGGFALAANLGYMIQPQSTVENLQVSNSFRWGLAGTIPIGAPGKFHIVPEFVGDLVVNADGGIGNEESPTEVILGGKYFLGESILIEGGFGGGLIAGYGAPDWRAYLGFTYRTPVANDRDGDGYLNNEDGCPDDPEDFDDFEDADGCSDPDNDGDTVRDIVDDCPLEPEDFDDFEDDNGCPDPDNDQDGILDGDDGDGGLCMNDPEDLDGFEDEDGCPDPDNDGDGILDVDDGVSGACMNDPEDMDGWEDEDGCSDPDNDGDGILDADDGPDGSCMNDAEDFDGFEDDDGCPEEGSGLVTLTCERIEISDSVYFETGDDEIETRSYELLDQIAGVLNSASYIQLVRIEGHTDDRGDDDYNLELSQDRANAVRTYLIEAGIEESRLVAEGFGEEQPIADNDTSEGRQQNRRVDFFIVEQDSRCDD